jgi:intracellular sulfur oxidation DsrE/DsrF family protein
MARCLALLVAACLSLAAPAAGPAPAGPGQGPTLAVERRQEVRVAYDIKDDVWEAGIGKALYYARGLIESYRAQGVPPEALRVSLVLHGPTAYWLVQDEPFRRQVGDPFAVNTNDKVVADLTALGVSVEVCGVTMRARGWTAADLLPGVVVVHDAYTRLIDLQQRGYAYIRF